MDKNKDPYVLNVYDLKEVDNICNQILREVIKLEKVSMAHVTMMPGNVSLLHEHKGMKEIYFILQGEGILSCGDKKYEVKKAGYLSIPTYASHKLKNAGENNLEHLVFAIPPFNPKDVFLMNDLNEDSIDPIDKELGLDELKENKEPFTALDGAEVYEIDSGQERKENNLGLAYGFLKGKRKAKPHHHKKCEEIYYIINGNGKVKLNDKKFEVKKGSVVYVPIDCVHGLENTKEENLEVLCLSSPPYKDGDFIPD